MRDEKVEAVARRPRLRVEGLGGIFIIIDEVEILPLGLSSLARIDGIEPAEAPGFDRIVFDFSGGIPSYDLTRQESPTFVKDASGQSVTLDGSAGIKLIFRDADVQGVADDQKPNLPAVREIAQLGNFERVLSYGIGLSSSQCVRVLELANPTRLVVDIITSTD